MPRNSRIAHRQPVEIPEPLWTVAEACEYLNVSERTFRYWIAQGRVPARRVGPRAIRVDRATVEQLASGRGVTVV